VLTALAMLLSAGCFPGDFQLDKQEPDALNPPASKNAATKATPHMYGAPPPLVVIQQDAGGAG